MATPSPSLLITTLHVDCVANPQPSLGEILKAIASLDGSLTGYFVCLWVDEETRLTVCGGKAGQYVCSVEFPHGEYVLCDPAQSRETAIPIFDGQPSLYVANHVVNLERVLEAA